MSENIDLIKQLYTGINCNDVDAVLNILHKNIVRFEFLDLPNSGTFRGHSELREHINSGRSTWDEGGCVPIEFIPVGNKTIVIVHVKVRLKDATEWIDGYTADTFAFKDGLISEFNSFTTKPNAIAWAQSHQ